METEAGLKYPPRTRKRSRSRSGGSLLRSTPGPPSVTSGTYWVSHPVLAPRDHVNASAPSDLATHQNNEVSIIPNAMSGAKCYDKDIKARDVVNLERKPFWGMLSEQNNRFLWLPRLRNTIPIPQSYWPDRLSRLARSSCFKVEAHADCSW